MHIPDLRARLWPLWHELRLRWWVFRGLQIALREKRAQKRERDLRIKRQFTSSIARTSLQGGRITRKGSFIR